MIARPNIYYKNKGGEQMPTEAQVRAQTRWEARKYDKVLLRMNKEKYRKEGELIREEIQAAADQAGESLNQYILEAVKMRIRCDKTDKQT
jgi:hypothetical protein